MSNRTNLLSYVASPPFSAYCPLHVVMAMVNPFTADPV